MRVTNGERGEIEAFAIVFMGAIMLFLVVWTGITESHRNDPDELAQHTPVTLRQMGVTDTSKAKMVGGSVTFHINTTNHSDRRLKITWCGPKHAYLDKESGTEEPSTDCAQHMQ
jgi:hypothetical protein